MAYVSATFQHLVEPITALYQQMVKRGTAAPTEVQASPAENGYAIAIVALVAFLIEGACAKARYVKNNTKRISAVETLKWLGDANLASDVEEVFVVRDAVAHSHLWLANVSWQPDDLIFVDSPQKLPQYGDAKLTRSVDMANRTTRRLNLDVFPNRIRRHTAVLAIKQGARVLQFLESIDRNMAYLSPVHVFVNGKHMRFFQWVDTLQL
jgi:hypothetical protein